MRVKYDECPLLGSEYTLHHAPTRVLSSGLLRILHRTITRTSTPRHAARTRENTQRHEEPTPEEPMC